MNFIVGIVRADGHRNLVGLEDGHTEFVDKSRRDDWSYCKCCTTCCHQRQSCASRGSTKVDCKGTVAGMCRREIVWLTAFPFAKRAMQAMDALVQEPSVAVDPAEVSCSSEPGLPVFTGPSSQDLEEEESRAVEEK